MEKVEDGDMENLPLLLPVQVMGLGGENDEEMASDDDDDDDLGAWVVVTQDVEMCTTCRQVDVTPDDRSPCAQCHTAGRLHRRCVEKQPTERRSSSVTTPSRSPKSPGRKRKRSASGSLSPNAASAAACAACSGDCGGDIGALETRRVAVLLQRDERLCWESCVVCRRDFSLHTLAADGDEDEDLLRNRIGRDTETGFWCRACCDDQTKAKPNEELVRKTEAEVASVEAMLQLEPTVEEGVVVEDEASVLLCDACDGEFDMFKLDPPLLEVPEGDWFCPACELRRHSAVGGVVGETHLVTLLICDGCEGEFDLASVQPPLVGVPEGDWFCNQCVAVAKVMVKEMEMEKQEEEEEVIAANPEEAVTEPAASEEQTPVPVVDVVVVAATEAMAPVLDNECDPVAPSASITENAVPEDGDLPSPAAEQTTAETAEKQEDGGVGLIECDGCDLKFDVETIRPAAPEVPKSDWFCDECEATRKRRKKGYAAMKYEKMRRLKALNGESYVAPVLSVTPKPVVPRVRVEPRRPTTLGLPLATTVTLLICDGCDGEYDMATLDPPLSSVPRGDWYCGNCAGVHRGSGSSSRRKQSAAATLSCSSCKALVPMDRNGQRAARRNGETNVLCGACTQQTKANAKAPVTADETKKRKRVVEAVTHDGRTTLDPVERIFVPAPVTVSFAAASNSSASASASQSALCAHVVCSDDEADAGGLSDDGDDHVIIVCEICLSEFDMIDVLGDSQSLAPPPRPWYCMPCLKRLKKNRKKKQRISKQMMLEMQLYGGLLRPTAAKAVDPIVRALRGKKPTSEDELLMLFELIGKRVGVMLAWDKQWVTGRVLSFDSATGNHRVLFDDDTEQELPLFAFPIVVGTSQVIEVKVPVSQNRWWPAHVLKMNAIAERQFMQVVEDPSVLASLRLVSLFSANVHAGKIEKVACWVPRHLCRAMLTGRDPDGSDGEYRLAVQQAGSEKQVERRVRSTTFVNLLQTAHTSGADVWRHIAQSLVGITIRVENVGECTVEAFDVVSGQHKLRNSDGEDQLHSLLVDASRVEVVDPHALAKLGLSLHRAQRGLGLLASDEASTTRDSESLEVEELKVLQNQNASIRSSPPASSQLCGKCNLPPLVDGDDTAATATETETGTTDSLVACGKCATAFHSYCCDPPHDKFPLISSEDGAVLVDDILTPFVCQSCVACAGCDAAVSSRWYRWRLPLQVVSLCESCVAVYDNNCQCAVCNSALDAALVDESPSLLKCSSCDLWVHPQCEPDPHPAFRRRQQPTTTEFELDISVALPDLSVEQDLDDDDEEEDSVSPLNGRSSHGGAVAATKPARLMDEEAAFELKFSDSYDARVLNNYECLSCRKVRMLRVLYRLRLEDKLDLFKEPVTKLIAPTYFDVIKQPMDLSTMQQRVLEGAYKRVNFRDFRDDFELLCLNAVTFNSRDRDFLIWREAWRFYGQGQRVLRQVAPKTRMKQRGGKNYDALVLAAKRQLPNNSQLGKTKLEGGGDGDDEDGEEDDDDEDDHVGDELMDQEMRESGQDGEFGVADQEVARVSELRGGDETTRAFVDGSVDGGLSGLISIAAAPDATSALAAKPTIERRRAASAAPAPLTFMPQSELGFAPKPHSALSFNMTMHSRSGAHVFCWIDACGVCGTRGAHDGDLVFCIDCGEGFHTFCVGVDEKKLATEGHPIQTYWRCANCEMCELCGKPHDKETEEEDENEWMECSHCDRSFHGKCLLPSIGSSRNDFSDRDDDDDAVGLRAPGDSFFCSHCVRCKSCNKTQSRATYSYDRDLCLSCCQTQKSEQSLMHEKTKYLLQVWSADTRRQRKDAEKCPMCTSKWSAEDADLIQCDACECWAHPQCDPVFADDPTKYQDLVNDASAQYVCSACRGHERSHLAGVPDLAKCQWYLAKIQHARTLCDARWSEARAQMRQAQQWNEWKENLAIYLYVLRVGEECLKSLAYRSVNFQDDWTRLAAKQRDFPIPQWLYQKAARYLRYKRYARGPRAAARKVARKNDNFYSQQGMDKQKEPHAIATIAAQASSCAALLVCAHFLYGWSPLQRVVFHLLERDSNCLSEPLMKTLLVENGETLEDEIAKIKKQYERRAGKKHLLRLQADDDDLTMEEEISPTGSSVSSIDPDFQGSSTDANVAVEAAKTMKSAAVAEPPAPSAAVSTAAPAAETVAVTETTPVASAVASAVSTVAEPAGTKPLIRMTQPTPLSGGARMLAPAPSLAATPAPPGSSSMASEDNRYCSLCFIVGEHAICGRLVYVELDQWVHLNCALWSSEVFEDAAGVLQRCQRALSRSKTNRCDGCGVLGATIGCTVSRCPRHYHFPCALDGGVLFFPNSETCCPLASHVQQTTKKLQLPEPEQAFVASSSDEPVPPAAVAGDQDTMKEKEDAMENGAVHDASSETTEASDATSAVAVAIAAAPPPQLSPLVKEPRHCVRVDFSSVFGDSKKRMNALHVKRQVCFRVGALTVHSLGHVVIGNPSFYTRDAVYPLGFRSTRVFWSARQVATRCLYECVVSSTDVEARKARQGRELEDKPFASPRALFKITASDDMEHPIVAASPNEALLELRSRVVGLYEDARGGFGFGFGSSAAADENPLLSRRSWFSYGLLGHHFFGFGVPEIAQEIESLPHVATTAIRRSFVVQRHRQQQNHRKRRRGQEQPDSVGGEDGIAAAGEHVYVFSHRLPSATEMALAMREVEQVVEAEEHARMSSGAVRTDGLDRDVDEEEEALRRATRRRLNKDATRDSNVQQPLTGGSGSGATNGGANANETASSGAAATGETATASGAKEKQGVPMDLEHLPIAMQYRELRRRPFDERLEVRKSKIHGYGLFTKEKFVEGQMIVEYQGQMIAQAVADVREKQYEEQGIGSCYMFRLDEKTIIDATRCGNLARFMNHSCDPKAFARVVVVESNEKKIVIFAKRTIEAFEEVTYDYKFPIEDEAIRCDCGAFNCIGRMN